MATGPADSWTFEVQWDGVNWTDESAYLLAGDQHAVRITRGRASEADDLQPGVLTGVLDNTTGRFTPDSPLSALYPNVKDGVRTRFTVTKDATTYSRHQGRLVTGEPVLEDGSTATAVVPFQSVGLLGELAGRVMRCDFVERWLNRAETQNVDIWPLEGSRIVNIGNGGGTGQIVPSKTGRGAFTVGAPDGIQLDSQIELSRARGTGPVIRLRVGPKVANSGANMVVVPFRTAARTPSTAGSTVTIATGYGVGGLQAWALKLKDNSGATDLNLYDASDAFVATLVSGFSPSGGSDGDDQWFVFSLETDLGGTTTYSLRRCADDIVISSAVTLAVFGSDTRAIVLGGAEPVTFGAVVVADYTSASYANYLSLNGSELAQDRFSDVALYADFSGTVNGTSSPLVSRKQLSGRSAFDVIAELARTVGADVTENRSAYSLDYWSADTRRPPTTALSVNIEEDTLAEFPWRKGDAPSSVTATFPGGQVTVTDSSRPRADETVETCAYDELSASYVASARVTSSRRLRLTRLVLDLATGANDKWADAMALEVGDRIRVNLGLSSSLLVTQYGYTYVDVYAVGWTETYSQGGATFEIDTIPADDPSEFEFDSDLRGRFCADGTMTVTGGTAVGTTSTGTIIVTTSSGPTVTTDSTAYPITFDWNGEYITVTSPPGGSTSPQTLTITARGVAPTVVRVHGTGEAFDVAYPPAFTF